MRTAIVNTATSANALHQIVDLVGKPVAGDGRAAPKWPACGQPMTLVNLALQTIREANLSHVCSRGALTLSLRESVDPQPRFTLVRSRRVESNCIANLDSGLKHEFEK
jgi:hypothetical protein